jgi:xylulokinase
MGFVIGVDVGSQSAKAVLVDRRGEALAHATASYDTCYPASGWAEQDPRQWERAIAHAVRQLRSEAGIGRDDVTMMALACQLDGLIALDHDRRPLRPAIVWLDRRAITQSSALAAAAGENELFARTGLNPDASHTGPKAMWIRDVEPDCYAAARWLTSVSGHLNGWLTGEIVHDHGNASSSLLYDLARRTWCDELIALAGLDGERLPAIRSACEILGPLRPDAADALGLTPACQVAVGTGDDQAAALGAGAVGPSAVVDVTGTAEAVAAPSLQPMLDEQRLLETHAHAVDATLLVENPGFVSGGSTRWWAGVNDISQADVFAQAALASPGCAGALFLPALSGATTPRWNHSMRGCFAGLGMHHERSHLARAILEGCAFALRDIVDRLSALGLLGDELRVVGGGARSRLWLQIKADVTRLAVRAVETNSAASSGAAMLAAVAAGWFDDLPEAADQTVRLAAEPVLPDPATAAVYAEAYADYRGLFDGVEGALA